MKRLALALAAIVTGVAAFWLVRLARDGDEPSTRPATGHDAGITRPDPGHPAGQAPDPGITRPVPGHAPADPGITQPDPGQNPGQRSFRFEDESRDPAWADEHEKEMTLRMRKIVDGLTGQGVVVDVVAIECRRSLCRVSLHAKDAAALGKTYAALEDPHGLYGWADNVLLESVQAESDGQVKTSVTAVFDRAE